MEEVVLMCRGIFPRWITVELEVTSELPTISGNHGSCGSAWPISAPTRATPSARRNTRPPRSTRFGCGLSCYPTGPTQPPTLRATRKPKIPRWCGSTWSTTVSAWSRTRANAFSNHSSRPRRLAGLRVWGWPPSTASFATTEGGSNARASRGMARRCPSSCRLWTPSPPSRW